MVSGVIGDATDQSANRYVIGVRCVMRDEADVTGDAVNSESGRKVADLKRAMFALFASGPRDKADGALNSRNVRVAFAVVGGENGDEGEVLLLESGPPIRGCRGGEFHAARNSKLTAAHSQGLDLFQAIAVRPEHRADFSVF